MKLVGFLTKGKAQKKQRNVREPKPKDKGPGKPKAKEPKKKKKQKAKKDKKQQKRNKRQALHVAPKANVAFRKQKRQHGVPRHFAQQPAQADLSREEVETVDEVEDVNFPGWTVNREHLNEKVPALYEDLPLEDVSSDALVDLFNRTPITSEDLKMWANYSGATLFTDKAYMLEPLITVISYCETNVKASPGIKEKLRMITKILTQEAPTKIDPVGILILLAAHGGACNVQKEVGISMAYAFLTNSVKMNIEKQSIRSIILRLLHTLRELIVEKIFVSAGHYVNTHPLVGFRNKLAPFVGLEPIPDDFVRSARTSVNIGHYKQFQQLYSVGAIVSYIGTAINVKPRRVDYNALVDWYMQNTPEGYNPYEFLSSCVFDEDSGAVTEKAMLYLLESVGVLCNCNDGEPLFPPPTKTQPVSNSDSNTTNKDANGRSTPTTTSLSVTPSATESELETGESEERHRSRGSKRSKRTRVLGKALVVENETGEGKVPVGGDDANDRNAAKGEGGEEQQEQEVTEDRKDEEQSLVQRTAQEKGAMPRKVTDDENDGDEELHFYSQMRRGVEAMLDVLNDKRGDENHDLPWYSFGGEEAPTFDEEEEEAPYLPARRVGVPEAEIEGKGKEKVHDEHRPVFVADRLVRESSPRLERSKSMELFACMSEGYARLAEKAGEASRGRSK